MPDNYLHIFEWYDFIDLHSFITGYRFFHRHLMIICSKCIHLKFNVLKIVQERFFEDKNSKKKM